MGKHIFLTGFMGSGKSYWGQNLADELHRPFVDLDHAIEQATGLPISRIFQEEGEQAFRQYESEALKALADVPDSIVATGGGAPCFADNLDWMKQHGVVIYLKTEVEVLSERLTGQKSIRPILAQVPDEELTQVISKLLDMRKDWYERANVVLIYQRNADQEFFQNLLRASAQSI
jgi:shikimate kinase